MAQEFFARYLPPALGDSLDLSTLHLTQASFVDSTLGEEHSDLLYEVQTRSGEPAWLYTLIEHKSYPSKGVGLQLHRYMGAIWHQCRKQGQRWPLPPIIPLVLYHGVIDWSISTDFEALIEAPDPLAIYTPKFRYLLCNLNDDALDHLQDQAWLAIALPVLKFIHRQELPDRLPGIFALFNALGQRRDGALGFLETVLRYLAEAAGQLDKTILQTALAQALPHEIGEYIMPTLAETWQEEGRQQGLQQGLKEGLKEGRLESLRYTLRKLLIQRFGPLPEGVNQQIEQGDRTLLESWFDQALTASSLDTLSDIK